MNQLLQTRLGTTLSATCGYSGLRSNRRQNAMADDITTLRRILGTARTIAVVGLSAEWHRPSHFAAQYMQAKGYRMIPVNPRYESILGVRCFARLEDIAEAHRGGLPEAEQRYVELVVALSRASFLDQQLETTLANASRCVDLARRHVDDLLVITLAVFAYATYLRGDSTGARTAVEEGIAHPNGPRQLHGFTYARAVHALLECEAGRPQMAEAEARETVIGARQLGLAGLWSAGIAHHSLGQALLQLGRVQEAERELERAEVLRRSNDPRLDHAHTLLALAQARIARGRLTLAATELAAAREHLDGFADVARLSGLADDVERQLEEARTGSPRAVEPPSPAELAVLRLLASELTQREIGSELFLSMNTVKTHTRNLYGKLGVRSREEAVRQANVLGLLVCADSPG